MQLKTYTQLLSLVITVILLAALSACHKSAGTDPVVKDNGKIIYVAGVVDSLNTPGARRAVYWKDGKKVILPYQNVTPDYNSPSDVWAMTAIGKDIYIGGGNYNSEGYWKNGVFNPLATDNPTTRSMANNGTDVFTSMNTGHGFLMYQNTQLLGNGGPSIAVEGNNIYVLALVNMKPFLQVNGVIGEAVSSDLAIAELLAVKNGDVYIAGEGFVNNNTGGSLVVKLLKNNKLIFTASESSGVTGLVVNGNDVYMTGYVNSTQAGLWKNGVLTILANNAYPVAVTVDGDDVYVAGTKRYPNDGTNGHACYWKNGVITEFTKQNSFAKAIVVVKK